MAGRKYSNQTGKRKPLGVTVKSRKTGKVSQSKTQMLGLSNRYYDHAVELMTDSEIGRNVIKKNIYDATPSEAQLNRAGRAALKTTK